MLFVDNAIISDEILMSLKSLEAVRTSKLWSHDEKKKPKQILSRTFCYFDI